MIAIRAIIIALLAASPAWAQQPPPDALEQQTVAQFQALATQLNNTSEAVQKLIDSRKKLQQELESLRQPKVSESLPPAGTGAPKP